MEVPLLIEADAAAVEHEEDCLVQDSSLMRRGRTRQPEVGGGTILRQREMPWNRRGWYNNNSSRCPVVDFRVADEDEINNHRNLLEVLRLSPLKASRKLLLSRTSEREIRRWEEMVHGCSSDSDSYCTWPDAMGREERVGRDGLSFDNEEGVAGSED
ncbi:hypothetical protein BHM03_00016127 [Ensete ventricosum]|uniref:Uncharacterized protein n=1 Tax=Ensete ventricosum TaxID=4639 RepID=A0A445MEP5_ENSVE|nr:hypothetical protein BHM03_00016127 [Ensete ventricosum]